jgi:hypothetical protein
LNIKLNIKAIFGWLLLAVFAFSITPKQLLHDVLADHTDYSTHKHRHYAPCVTKTGFSCDRLNLVAESPFVPTEKPIEAVVELYRTDFIVVSDHKAFPKAVALPSLRGPPCM